MFGSTVEAAARAHALAEWPREACGVVSDGLYVPIENVAGDPENAFEMPASTWLEYQPQAVIHSHNAALHPHHPSKPDMTSQISTGVPFGIVSCDGETATPVLWWGDQTLDASLIGREFVPGVFDCYSLVRGYFWQEKGVKLPDFPRNDKWWEDGENMLVDYFREAGFIEVDKREAQPGDGFLMKMFSSVPCHSGIILERGLCLHHLTNRLSRREPIGPWSKRVSHIVRYQGA